MSPARAPGSFSVEHPPLSQWVLNDTNAAMVCTPQCNAPFQRSNNQMDSPSGKCLGCVFRNAW